MGEKKLYDNKQIFIWYGLFNVVLFIILLTILIFLINEIYILNRIGFVLFVGTHLFLVFFVKIHYMSIYYNDDKQKIEFHYNRRFGLKWQNKIRTVLLPLKQFDSYKISKDSMGLGIISFYKLEQNERYELGPFHVGIILRKEKQIIKDTLGETF